MQFILKGLSGVVAIAGLTGILAIPAGARVPGNCDSKLEKQAREQPEPKNWNDLYRLFKKFGACDDGRVADRFSSDVGQLFSTQWDRLDTLARLVAADETFEQFVLRHIDATLEENDLLHLVDNSKRNCPAADNRICGLVHARAQDSLDTVRDASE